ncbi:MAG: hypothetical protein KGJ35_00100 [Patescibacteria group bacterium]|nr:hypothetical protein [Patescibacteria group bacterium]
MNKAHINILKKVRQYSSMPDGAWIDKPDERISVGDFYITNRVIKHFVESRKRQNADPELLVNHLFDAVLNPDYVIENPSHSGQVLIGKMISGEHKAIALPIDIDGRIKSVFFQQESYCVRLKNQMIALGGAAHPSSFLPPESGSLAASLSALQKRSLGSLTSDNSINLKNQSQGKSCKNSIIM